MTQTADRLARILAATPQRLVDIAEADATQAAPRVADSANNTATAKVILK
jgi:hypothetical protein